jgi:hypothetical protein
MGLFYRALGIMASVNEFLRAFRLYHAIRLDWIGLVVPVVIFADACAQLQFPRTTGGWVHPRFNKIVEMAFAVSAFALAVVAMVRQNVIFRPGSKTGRCTSDLPPGPRFDSHCRGEKPTRS